MSIFNKFFNKSPSTTRYEMVTEHANGFYMWNGKLFQSDIIRACIRPKTQAIGKLVAKHIRTDVTGIKVNPEPYLRFLLEEPNPYMTGQVMQEKLATQLALKGWINGYYYENTAALNMAIDVADGVLKRVDRVVLRLDQVGRQIILVVKKGTPASSPVAPVLTRTSDVYELALADVLINNGDTSISQAKITDQRLNIALCGIVHGTVEQVDTVAIFTQYQAALNSFETTKQAEFTAWVLSLQDILDANTAGNLLNLINNHKDDSTLHKTANIPMTNYVVPASGGAVVPGDTINQAIGKLEKNATADKADIASQAVGKGASMIGVQDAGNHFTGTNIEAVLSELFTFANDGKTSIANAVTAKGVSASPSDTFAALATKIGQINTGKKFATGLISSTASVSVTGLAFTPTLVLGYLTIASGASGVMLYEFVATKNSEQIASGSPSDKAISGNIINNTLNATLDAVTWTATGFSTGLRSQVSGLRWYAFE